MPPLIPRNEKSLAPFTEMASLLCEAATKLRELLQRYDRIPERVREIKDYEHRGDKITHGVLENLAKSFITPFDREDMHRLATDLDDVLDMIDNRLCEQAKNEAVKNHLIQTRGHVAMHLEQAKELEATETVGH